MSDQPTNQTPKQAAPATAEDDRKVISIFIESHEFRATDRSGLGWDVEIILPGAFTTGMTRDEALETLRRLRHAFMAKARRTVRTECSACGRMVAIDKRGRFHWHGVSDAAPGRNSVRCAQSGQEPEV